jgi:MOSC domain
VINPARDEGDWPNQAVECRLSGSSTASLHRCTFASPPRFTGQLGPICAGRTVVIGDTVRLAITESCPRCVMITLPQVDLPKDAGILRTAAQHNGVNVGVYASVVNGGTIRSGDAVVFA